MVHFVSKRLKILSSDTNIMNFIVGISVTCTILGVAFLILLCPKTSYRDDTDSEI